MGCFGVPPASDDDADGRNGIDEKISDRGLFPGLDAALVAECQMNTDSEETKKVDLRHELASECKLCVLGSLEGMREDVRPTRNPFAAETGKTERQGVHCLGTAACAYESVPC